LEVAKIFSIDERNGGIPQRREQIFSRAQMSVDPMIAAEYKYLKTSLNEKS
jgi:hypothetical protein